MIQTFSQKLSAHLSSLVPGMKGHWEYVKTNDGISIRCEEDLDWLDSEHSIVYPIICPAWQVEDLLRNLTKIIKQGSLFEEEYIRELSRFATEIIFCFIFYPDTVYQKIEEYLWSVLK